jgi:glycosyl transferase family 87
MAKFKILLTSVLLVSLFFHSLYLCSQINNMAAGNGDFVIFYTGAQMLTAGRGSQLYDLEAQKIFQDKFKVPLRDGPLPYNHPAYELLLFLPLTYLSFSTAHMIWSLVSIILLLLTFLLLKPFVKAENQWLFTAMLIAFFPTATAIMYGQDSILTAFLLAGMFVALKQKRHMAAGSILALGLYKPQLVLPIACFLVYKRCWRACASFMLTAAVLIGISIVLVGHKGFSDFTVLLRLIDRLKYTIDPAKMANIRGLMETLLDFSRPFGVNTVVFLSSALLLLWSLSACAGDFDPTNHSFDLEFSLMATVTLLTSYHLYAHDLTLLALPTILTLNSYFVGRIRDRRRSRAIRTIVLTLWFPLALLVLIEYRLLYLASIPILLFAIVLAKEISYTRSQAQTLIAKS